MKLRVGPETRDWPLLRTCLSLVDVGVVCWGCVLGLCVWGPGLFESEYQMIRRIVLKL